MRSAYFFSGNSRVTSQPDQKSNSENITIHHPLAVVSVAPNMPDSTDVPALITTDSESKVHSPPVASTAHFEKCRKRAETFIDNRYGNDAISRNGTAIAMIHALTIPPGSKKPVMSPG